MTTKASMSKPYVASKPFEPRHPEAMAVYCSDGRFTDAVEELLHGLGYPRLDTLTMPGGPGLLDLASASFSELEAARRATTFLIRGHATKQVVLLAHAGCGYYANRYPLDRKEQIIETQLTDLRVASRWVKSTHDGVAVQLYFASVAEGRIHFNPIAA
jgi:hypothetical protein